MNVHKMPPSLSKPPLAREFERYGLFPLLCFQLQNYDDLTLLPIRVAKKLPPGYPPSPSPFSGTQHPGGTSLTLASMPPNPELLNDARSYA